MDPYKTPDADLSTNSDNPYQPIRAVIYGLCISVIVVMIASVIEGVAFGIMLGVNFADQDGFKVALANSTAFMITDIVVSSAFFFLAGRVVGHRVPGNELKYGIIVGVITVLVFTPLVFDSDPFGKYPFWYNLISVIVFLVVIPLGALSTKKSP